MARLAIVEDQELFLLLLKDLCERKFGHEVVLTSTNRRDLLANLPKIPVDLVLLDLNLPDNDGPALASEIRAVQPTCRVIAVSGQTTPFMLHQTIEAGIDGFVDKSAPPANLKEAIDTVLGGAPYFTAFIKEARKQLRASPNAFTKVLSKTELTLMPLLGRGLANEAIATERGISIATVQTHRKNIMAKLDLHSSIELMRYAFAQGFVCFRSDGTVPEHPGTS
jgi:DNA-binding NarL/FixJ family response regulator